MKIRITQEDIDNGKPADPCKCPTALAVCRAMGIHPDDELIEVTDECINLIESDSRIWWALPDEMIAFIDYFDNGTPVKPIEFEAIPSVRS